MAMPELLSIVIPVYNEILNLEALTGAISRAMDDVGCSKWEAVLVDDGSTDGSGAWLARFCRGNQHFRAVHFRANQGQTAAFDAGFQAARGDWILTMDADLQNDPGDIPKLLPHMAPKVGAICGVRVNRQDNFIRRISSKIANGVRNKLSDDNITDTGCSLKLFRAEVLKGIPLFEGMHRFFPTLIKMEGYKVIEVPVSHHPRHAGTSKYGVWNRLFRSFGDLLAVRWMKARRLRYEHSNQPNPELQPGEAGRSEKSRVEMSHV